MKKQKPELVNLAELARKSGVRPCAVSNFLRKQEAQGSPVPAVSGKHRRERLVDLNHPAVQAYLKNQTAQPGNRGHGKPPTQAALAKLQAQAEKIELAASVLRDKYVDRSFTLQYLDKFLETFGRELDLMVGRILQRLSKEFGLVTAGKMPEIKNILRQPCDDVLEMCRREVEKFQKDTAIAGRPELTAPASGGKHGKPRR
jgi:hypothetical protein